ncbi:cyclic nucleotide-binding domain-containing protein [Clostridium sp. MCC353]|uniref:Crp/Fnr family transcriptional regulator n=1 Tax=Clostridium sp. MCC353 TaxID=2592646 RepID=UPI001C025B1A|nr:Crp/Fnr family transcriptional regulator [Clostridium sp. MCC353]MBT9775066.1 cyclic nucleotide-binding domain-containing protein [Clostridium sp. MCC353]
MNIPEAIAIDLTDGQLDFLHRFFRNCPDSFAANFIYKKFPKNHRLISAGDSCSHVYLLLDGRLQAVEEYVTDDPYSFMEIPAMDIVGDYELFQQVSHRVITLTTLEASSFLIIPSNAYFSWIQNDANALFIRTQKLISQISTQNQIERQNFFLDNKTRLIYFLFTECSRLNGQAPPYSIAYTRPQIAQKLGCSVRTINRSLLSLKKEGAAAISRGKIQIQRDQYLWMQEYLQQKMRIL